MKQDVWSSSSWNIVLSISLVINFIFIIGVCLLCRYDYYFLKEINETPILLQKKNCTHKVIRPFLFIVCFDFILQFNNLTSFMYIFIFLEVFIQKRYLYLEICCRAQRCPYTIEIPMLKPVKFQLIKSLIYQEKNLPIRIQYYDDS